jgi:hypothetical protein
VPARRRSPLGTQPPVTSERQASVSGEIEKPDPLEAQNKADEEHAVIVHVDDDWLSRLDLPTES